MVKFTPTTATNYPLHKLYFNKMLKTVEMIKFLGLQLDNHLTYKGHIYLLLHKLSTVGFLMRKLSCILSIDNLKSVYYAYYHSLVKYGIIYWGNKSDSHKVFLMQKKIIRIMMRVGPTHTCRDLFKKLGILPIPCVYLHSLMIFVLSNTNKFQANNSVYMINTRSNDPLHIPITHLSSHQRGVYYSGVKLFNTLLTNISDLKNDKNQFRIVLRSYLLNSFYSIDEFIEHAKSIKVKSE
jgi:hypothetical protein